MVLGEQVLVENQAIDDFKAMADLLISSCPKESWISIMASNTLKRLTTASSAILVKEKFEINNKTINEAYNVFISKYFSGCANQHDNCLRIVELEYQLHAMDKGDKDQEIAFKVLSTAVRQSAISIVQNE